jgi:hypothetical protein
LLKNRVKCCDFNGKEKRNMNPLDSIWGTIISGFVVAVILALIF